MGTRHLVCVYDGVGELRVAQYGQWDGYPDGQGVKVLEAARDSTLEERARGAVLIDEATYKERWKEFGVDLDKNSMVSMDVSEKFAEKHPNLHRNVGAGILNLLPCEVMHSVEFAADGLFCEWAYVIDYQNNVLEVYQGFNRGEGGRFANMKPVHEDYSPVGLVQSWPLDDLPTSEVFINRLTDIEDAA